MQRIEPDRWGRLSRHLDQVLDLPEVEWTEYLAALGRSDPATATDLQELLRARDSLDFASFLGESMPFAAQELAGAATSAAALEAGAISDSAAPPLIGRRIGPYVIEAEVGRGGMGSVWRARRADGLFEGHVAVKLLHLAWLGRAGEQRFLLEGRLLARLDHPNIARLLDAGVLDGGQPYLVLEYVEGDPIDVCCDRAALDVDARIRLFMQALSAVAHAHRQLIVHRDLKPSNVLVAREGEVKLLDFGVAKLLDASADAAPTRTILHGLTPRYAAPEQLIGEPVTTATDVYSLGLMLYQLLTGRHPFEDEPETHAILAAVAPRASTVAVGRPDRRRALEGDLDNILAKALKPAPAERYASIDAFAEDLRRYLGHQPVLARPDSMAYRMGKFVRRHRGAVIAGLIAVLALAGAAAVATDQMLEARRQRDLALDQLQRSQAFSDLVAIVLAESSATGEAVTPAELLDRGESLVRSEFASSSALRADLQYALGRLYANVGLTGKQRELYGQAYAAALQSGNRRAVALTGCAVASADAVVGRSSGAADRVRRLIASLPPGSASDEARASCLVFASIIARLDGDGTRAVATAEAADRILGSNPAATQWERLSTAITLADAQREQGRFREADATYGRVARGFERLGVDHTAFAGTLFNNWAIDLESLGQPRRAASLMERVIAMDRAQAATDAFDRTVYAAALVALARPDEARRLLEPALADALANGNLRSASMVRMGLARAYQATGELDRAQVTYGELERDLKGMLPAGHEAYGALHLGLAQLAQRRLDHAVALREAGLALAVFGARPGLARRAAVARLTRAESLLALRRPDEALAEASRALDAARAIAGPSAASFDVGRAWLMEARARAAMGDRAAAQAAARDARVQLVATAGAEHPLAREAGQLAGQ